MSHASMQFKQLPMFMTPAEAGQLRSNDYRGSKAGEITPEMRDAREKDAWGYRGALDSENYLDRMKWHHEGQGGVETPIHVWHHDNDSSVDLVDGHHRVAVAQKTGHLLPVVHHEGNANDVMGSAFLGPTADPEMRQQFGHRGDSRPTVDMAAHAEKVKEWLRGRGK